MSFRFLLRPKWIFWTVFVALAVVLMLNLARWQWDRHQGRQDANAQIEARLDEPVVALGEVVGTTESPESAEADTFRRVTATGTYLPEAQVLVANRTLEGAAGWWVVTPLVLDDGSAVAVNRGFVPRSVTPEGPWDEFAPPEGEVTVTGILQASQARQAGPTDDPRTLPRLNVELLDGRMEANLVPLWLQLETQDPAQASGLPVVLPEPELSAGSHLSYTGQWLIFASLTVIVYVVLVVRTAKRGEGEEVDRSGGVSAGASPGPGPGHATDTGAAAGAGALAGGAGGADGPALVDAASDAPAGEGRPGG